jgi:hypothetical protein
MPIFEDVRMLYKKMRIFINPSLIVWTVYVNAQVKPNFVTEKSLFQVIIFFNFLITRQPLVGHGPIFVISTSHSHIPQSIGLLRTSDQLSQRPLPYIKHPHKR